MEEHQRTRFDARGLVLAGRPGDGRNGAARHLRFFAGAMHYWRVAPDDWRPCLRAMKAMGLELVQTYVPWSVHEAAAGRFEWDNELDLGAFLDAVADLGMLAVVRPGPHINAELTGFGFPERILRRADIQARSARDTPVWLPAPPRSFPVPSYASAAFIAETETWLGAAAEVIAPRLWPDGPVVALQVDNEHHMFFRTGAFDLDYHPDALAWWRAWVDDDDALIEPPRGFRADDAERCARWVGFKEHYAARALGWVTDALERAGLGGVARYHNLPPIEPFHANAPAIERAIGGPCGTDFYHVAADYPVVRRRARYLAGTASPLALAPEVGVGGAPWIPPMSHHDQRNVILGLLASGVRGMGLYMTVDRDRWYGAAIGPGGEPEQPVYEFLQRLMAVLARVDVSALERDAVFAVLVSRADARHGTASSVADPVSPLLGEFLGLGPAGAAELALDPAAAEYRRWIDAIERALAIAQIPYDLVDEAAPAARLARYRAVIAPTFDRCDTDTWQRLAEAAARGLPVVVGPRTPTLDSWGRPVERALGKGMGLLDPASASDVDALASDLTGLAGDLEDVWVTAEPSPVDVSVFRAPGGQPVLVFAAETSGAGIRCDLLVPAGCRLVDAISGESFDESSGSVDLVLAGWQVRMFELAQVGAMK